jgi:hypothetical protein
MELAHSRHGNPDGRTRGRLVGHGRTYDIRAAILFGGRRRRVFGQLAAASRARPGDRVLDVGCGTRNPGPTVENLVLLGKADGPPDQDTFDAKPDTLEVMVRALIPEVIPLQETGFRGPRGAA